MRQKILAVAAASVMVVAAAAGIAGSAGAVQTKDATIGKVFKTTLTPKTGIHTGTVLTLKGTKALKNTAYYCVMTSAKDGVSAPDVKHMQVVKSNAKGAISCKIKFAPFTGTGDSDNKKHSCPPSPADKKAGFKCAIAFADQATIGAMSAGAQYFTATK